MQVAAALTPSNAPHVAGAIVEAYRTLRSRDLPAKSSWLWPLALSANETAEWQSMYNWNVGNVTTSRDDVSWFYNPKVSSPLKFRAFSDARSGAYSMLKALDRYGGLVAADSGDVTAWQNALNSYLGSTYPSLNKLIARLQDVQPETQVIAPQRTKGSDALVVVAALGLAATAGYVAYRTLPVRRFA